MYAPFKGIVTCVKVAPMANEIHIRSNATGRYLNVDGAWRSPRGSARQFLSAAEAQEWCSTHGLANVEIIIVRDSLVCMRFPIPEKS